MSEGSYDLVVARPGARTIAESLPEAVAAAVIDFITGSLIKTLIASAEHFETICPAFTAHAGGATASCTESTTTNEQSRCSASITAARSTDPADG